jgi:O-antigen ligase
MQYFGQIDVLGMWVNSARVGEAYANLRQRNQFATLTGIGLLTLIWQLARMRGRPEPTTNCSSPYCNTPMPSWSVAVVLVVLAMGNAASGSRTGLLQWIAVGALAVLWRAPGQWRLPVVALCALTAYGVAAVGLPWVLHAATGAQSAGLLTRLTEETGCSSRLVLWSNVLHLIAQKPWLGWGWGELDFAHFITLYPGERFCDILDNAHNLPLHLAVELGVPFALTVCGGLMWVVVRSRPWRETDPTRQLAWGVLAVIAVHSLLEYPLWYGPFQMAALLSIGLLCKVIPTNAP